MSEYITIEKHILDDVQAALENAVSELSALREENERLKDYKADVENAVKMSLDEKCTADEKHCTCVPLLRQEVKRLQGEICRLMADKGELVDVCEKALAIISDTNCYHVIANYPKSPEVTLGEFLKAAVQKHKEG